MRWWLAAALALGGCYGSHPSDGEGGVGIPCGAITCPAGALCCSRCDADPICVPGARDCPPIVCPPCFTNRDCAPGEYCRLDPTCAPPGACDPRPTVCDPGGVPACTCEGEIFPSACDAAAAGRTARPIEECGVTTIRCPELCDWLIMACGDVIPPETCVEDCGRATSDCSAAEWDRVAACLAMGECMTAVACASEIPCFFTE